MRSLPIVLRTAAMAAAIGVLMTGCTPTQTGPIVNVAPGVTFTRDARAGIQILEADLQTADAHPEVVAANIRHRAGAYVGDCHTVRDWADGKRALGGINGGFFGDTFDQVGLRKQIVGLAVADGAVLAPSTGVSPRSHPELKIVRSTLGVAGDGTPEIAWATAQSNSVPHSVDWPVNGAHDTVWPVRSAVMCGPRLFQNGVQRITDHEEWLVSPGKLCRSFIAWDAPAGRPRHLVLGRADAMDFADIATYLTGYFDRLHGTKPSEAMCLDGGPSAQIAYRTDDGLQDAVPTGVLVPTAVLLVPNHPARAN